MTKKYEFTGEVKEFEGVKVKRIRRIKDGLLGGWVESEYNLSYEGSCFIYNEAIVCGYAHVKDDARVEDNALISGDAVVKGNALVKGNAKVLEQSCVKDYAVITGNAVINSLAVVRHRAIVRDYAEVGGNARVRNRAKVMGTAKIEGGTIIGNVQVPYDDIEFYQSVDSRLVTAIKLGDEWRFNIGCQNLITKEVFLERIDMDGGVRYNPHRAFYKKILSLF